MRSSRSSRRLFTRRPHRGFPFFGVAMAVALLGALVLTFSPAHTPAPGHSHLQAHAAQLASPAPPVATTVAAAPVAAPPRRPAEARSSLIIIERKVRGTKIRFQGRPLPP